MTGNMTGNLAEFVADILDGKALYIPQTLSENLKSFGRKKEGRETLAMTYQFVALLYAHQQEKNRKRGIKKRFVEIHSSRFEKAIDSSSATITKAKKWLKKEGFLEVGESYSAGRKSKTYRPIRSKNLVKFETEKNANRLLESHTGDDPNSIAYRKNLDCLEFDREQFVSVLRTRVFARTAGRFPDRPAGFDWKKEEEETLTSLAPTVYPVSKIVNKQGRVFRDKTGRLHSPFTQLHKQYRCCFKVAGESLIGIDMKSCQPTLLALVSGDDALLESCLEDKLYQEIAAKTGTNREEANALYCWWAYGTIKTQQTPKNTPVFQVQEMFREQFPTANNYALKQKSTNYRRFSHQMMRRESELFIDGVFTKLCKEKMFCLTIHDGVYLKENDGEAISLAKELIDQNLRAKFKIAKHAKDKKFRLSTISTTKETTIRLKQEIINQQ